MLQALEAGFFYWMIGYILQQKTKPASHLGQQSEFGMLEIQRKSLKRENILPTSRRNVSTNALVEEQIR